MNKTINKIAAVVLTLTSPLLFNACSSEYLASETGSAEYLTITAKAPAEAFGSATRAELADGGLSGLTICYTPVNGEGLLFTYSPSYAVYDPADKTITFTTKGDEEGNNRIVWDEINKDENGGSTFYLIVNTTGEERQFWGSCSVAHGSDLNFGTLRSRFAKLSINVTVQSNTTLDSDEKISVYTDLYEAEDSAHDITEYVWPVSDNTISDPFGTESNPAQLDINGNTGTVSVSRICAEQDFDGILTFHYLDKEWTLDISEHDVAGGEEGQKANQLKAGQHLTISATLNMISLTSPFVTITDIEAATEYTGTINSPVSGTKSSYNE